MGKLRDELIDGRGEQSLEGLLIKADRGYVKQTILKLLSDLGIR